MSTRRRRRPDDLADEIRAHVEIETDRLVAEGMSRDDARLAARRSFGSLAIAEERFYESHRWMWLDRARQDARGAWRSLVRYPLTAAVAILSMAAGIGATTTMLTVRNVIFHNPPPGVADAAQLSRVQVGRADRLIMPIGSYVPGELYAAWAGELGASIAASTPPRGVRDVRLDDRVETVPVRPVTAGLFALLGAKPAIGSTFAEARESETRSAGQAATVPAILPYRYWQQWFDERPDAIGRVIWIDNRPHTIIGVMPPRFWFSDMDAPIWTAIDPAALGAIDALEVVVRRPPGVSPRVLETQLEAGLARYASARPAAERQMHLEISPVEGTPMGHAMSILLPWVIGVSVILTLLIACANVAVLMIAQWTAREHEMAIRASLGASRLRLVRSLLAEAMLAAIGGGVLGVGITLALRALVVSRSGPSVALFDLSIQPRVLVQSALVTLASGILAGLAPALYETRRLHVNPLRTIAGSDRVRQRWRHALVVFEIAVTVALLVETVAMIGGYQRALDTELGFRTRPLLSARIDNPAGVPIATVLSALDEMPGVAVVAASTSIPFSANGPIVRITADASATPIAAERGAITPGFFAALEVPLRAGRAFTPQDSPISRVAIVNETLARRLFAGGDAIGRRALVGDTAYDIVGVVSDYLNNPFQRREDAARVFVPMDGQARDAKNVRVLIRASADPRPLVQAVRRAARNAAPGNAVTSAFTFDQIRTVMGEEILVGTAPLAPLITIGLLLTMAGIYGVLAFSITRRSRELAVRMAIGATGRDLARLVAAHSGRLVMTGAVLGLGVMWGLTRILRAVGGANSVFDPDWVAFVAPFAIIAAIAALATWLPSRRVRRIDPAAVLRSI
jgi:predicted permease